MYRPTHCYFFFFFNDTAPPEIYTLSLHDALPILADFPSVTIRPGATSTVSLKLQNWGLPPEMLDLSVQGEPSGWHVSLLGGGQPVAAAMPPTNGKDRKSTRLNSSH